MTINHLVSTWNGQKKTALITSAVVALDLTWEERRAWRCKHDEFNQHPERFVCNRVDLLLSVVAFETRAVPAED